MSYEDRGAFRSIFDIEVIDGEGNILTGNGKAIPLEDLFDLIVRKSRGLKPLFGGITITYDPSTGLPERYPATDTNAVSGRTVSRETFRRIIGAGIGVHPMYNETIVLLRKPSQLLPYASPH